MKVAIFIGSLTCGGAERVTVSLARYLAERGVKISVITMHGIDKDFYVLDDRVERVALGLSGTNHPLSKVQANIQRILALRQVIRSTNPDVLIGMMSSAALFCIFASIGLENKVIASERNYPGSKPIAASWAILRRLFYRFASAHVAQTNDGGDWIMRNTKAKNIFIIHNSVSWPLPTYEPLVFPENVVSGEDKLVLAVGGKVFQKGIDLLVKAFVQTTCNLPNWHLVVVGLEDADHGQGNQMNKLRQLVGSLVDNERVHFPGRVGNMKDWYQQADIFVLSSRYEGFPNALLEAMSFGCASIAFDCKTGPNDVITDGVDGILAEPDNERALAVALRRLMENEKLRQELGAAAIKVRERFSESNVLRLWLDAIQRTADGHQERP